MPASRPKIIIPANPQPQRKLKPSEFNESCTDCDRYFWLVADYEDHFKIIIQRDEYSRLTSCHLVCLTEDEQHPWTQCPRCGEVFRRNRLNRHWEDQAIPTQAHVPNRAHGRYHRSQRLYYANPCGADLVATSQPTPPTVMTPIVVDDVPMMLDPKDQLCDACDTADDDW